MDAVCRGTVGTCRRDRKGKILKNIYTKKYKRNSHTITLFDICAIVNFLYLRMYVCSNLTKEFMTGAACGDLVSFESSRLELVSSNLFPVVLGFCGLRHSLVATHSRRVCVCVCVHLTDCNIFNSTDPPLQTHIIYIFTYIMSLSVNIARRCRVALRTHTRHAHAHAHAQPCTTLSGSGVARLLGQQRNHALSTVAGTMPAMATKSVHMFPTVSAKKPVNIVAIQPRRAASESSAHLRRSMSSSSSAEASQPSSQAIDHKYVLNTYKRMPVTFVSGEGCWLVDENGDRYLDFAAGIAVNSLGHSHPELNQIIAQESARLIHTSNLYHTVPGANLAKAMIESAPEFDKVFFCNSGTEANEAALKFARKVAYNAGHIKPGILSFHGSFHGRTIGALSVTAKEAIRKPFEPLLNYVQFGQFNSVEGLTELFTPDIGTVILEPIQGEGGVFPASPEFYRAVRDLCDKHGAVMISDEVQCGVGRTGNLWGHTACGDVVPDIVTLAKPLANGLPIGAVVVKEHIAKAIQYGDHGSTFAGGPMVTAVASAVFRIISEPEFLQEVQRKGKLLRSKLDELIADPIVGPRITAVRSHGLIAGIQFVADFPVDRVVAQCLKHGLLAPSAGANTLRFLPPLIVSDDEIDMAVERLHTSISDTSY
jgi:acetylornithine/N-succinyldiaminopimelate aminotransferase